MDSQACVPSTAEQGPRWFAVQAQARAEIRACVHLERQGFGSYCPQMRKIVRHARKSAVSTVAMFPGYLFVRLDLSRDRWRAVNGTPGVVGIVMFGDLPSPVPGGVVEGLQQSLGRGDGAQSYPWLPGTAVRVAKGPFADLVGRLQRLDSSGRVRVLLDLMGRSVSVALRWEALDPAA